MRKRALFVAATALAAAIAGGVAAIRDRAASRRAAAEQYERTLVAWESDVVDGPVRREFERDLPASLARTLDLMERESAGFWLEAELPAKRCKRVVRSYGDDGAEACLVELERGRSVESALECFDIRRVGARIGADRVRRAVGRYAHESGTIGADARAILGWLGGG